MGFIKELSNKAVSISGFNRGLAGRIFDGVRVNGSRVVLKNNVPKCILVSPGEYTKLIDKLEDARDLMLANTRMSSMDKSDLTSQDEFEKAFHINLSEVSPLDENEVEWTINYPL